MPNFTCLNCGNRKTLTKDHQKFCSTKCRKHYWEKQHVTCTIEDIKTWHARLTELIAEHDKHVEKLSQELPRVS